MSETEISVGYWNWTELENQFLITRLGYCNTQNVKEEEK